jgi:peptidoglycan/xylan/chitin deacetylase (PgdA/CDA1 family)
VPGNGFASITFDDGKMNQFQNAKPALDAAGVKGTFYIISDALTWGSSSMSANEVRQLRAAGHEIGNHTASHAKLTTLSASAVEKELAGANAAIKAATGATPSTCAYPYGQSNDTVRSVAAKHFSACRGTNGGTNPPSGFSRYDLRTFYVTTGTSVSAVRDAAASAKAAGTWIIFVYHGVGSVNTTDDVTTQQFTDQLGAIRGTGISIRTVGSLA